MSDFSITYFGDYALLIQGPKVIYREVNQKLVYLKNKIISKYETVEVVCTYQSLAVYGNEKQLLESVKSSIEDWILNLDSEIGNSTRKVVIPVCYEKSYGIDLERVANHNQLDVEEVIQIHSSQEYYVYFIGFLPGFPYLGGLNEKLSTPRLKTPRSKINAGSVGIADQQTGVYPSSSPGGWNIIGQTPISLFNRNEGAVLKAGDTIVFESISTEKYKELEKKVEQNKYIMKTLYD